MSEYHRIPPLGQHYTQRWAKEDIENERQKGAASATAGANAASGDEAKAGILEDAQKALKKETLDETPHGELTQRLVAGLIEENIMTSVEESIDAHKSKNAASSEAEDKTNLIRSVTMHCSH